MRLTGSFELAAPLHAVLGLFTPEGERRWVPDWQPVWAQPAGWPVWLRRWRC